MDDLLVLIFNLGSSIGPSLIDEGDLFGTECIPDDVNIILSGSCAWPVLPCFAKTGVC